MKRKGKSGGKYAKDKGKRYEREVADAFSQWHGIPYMPTPSSGAMKEHGGIFVGDIAPEQENKREFVIECKYKTNGWGYWGGANENGVFLYSTFLIETYIKVREEAKKLWKLNRARSNEVPPKHYIPIICAKIGKYQQKDTIVFADKEHYDDNGRELGTFRIHGSSYLLGVCLKELMTLPLAEAFNLDRDG